MVHPASGSGALALRLVARRHVDLHRVSSALCRAAR
ncbi:putative leader peptide [Pseudonocardia sp. GCM10023141]